MIDRNRVEEIQPGAFSQLGFLNLLSLTNNHLVYIPNMAFQVARYLDVQIRPPLLECLFKKPIFSPSRVCRTSNGFVSATTL